MGDAMHDAAPPEFVYASIAIWAASAAVVGWIARDEIASMIDDGELRAVEAPVMVFVVTPAVIMVTLELWASAKRGDL